MAALHVKKKVMNPIFVIMMMVMFAHPTTAFWRLLCHGTLGYGRVDPIVSPGAASNHVHVGFGAQAFGFGTTPEMMMASNCTSCAVLQDRSLYWSPALYYHFDSNDTYKMVNTLGGMDSYYFTNDTVGPFNMTAFPLGFRMIAGDFRRRNASGCDLTKPMSFWNATDMSQECLSAKAVGMNCLNYSPNYNEGAMEFNYLRNSTFIRSVCVDGLRAEMQFPSCWNGKDLDSPDHKSHILYPSLGKTGVCPPGFPVKTPTLFYETIYDVYAFNNEPGEFVFANGDPTGYGYHGDFMAGWNVTVLQSAIDICTSASGNASECPFFDLQSDEEATSCQMDVPDALAHESIKEVINLLPGNVPIQRGPAYATIPGHPGPISSSTTSPALVPPPAPLSSSPPPSAAPSASAEACTTIYSSIITAGNTVEVVIIEEVVTEVAYAAKAKRYGHKHRHGGHRV